MSLMRAACNAPQLGAIWKIRGRRPVTGRLWVDRWKRTARWSRGVHLHGRVREGEIEPPVSGTVPGDPRVAQNSWTGAH